MFRNRIIPTLLLKNRALVKTVNFKNPKYIGDPINAVKIFNEKCADELILLDISASIDNKEPDFDHIKEIVSEAFMPIAYGGGIKTTIQIRELFRIGCEKVVINTSSINTPDLIKESSKLFGNQSIVVAMDVKKNLFNKYSVYMGNGSINTKIDPISHAMNVVELGAGELFINSIDNDGTYKGFDLELIKSVTRSVSVPVIGCGGAGKLEDISKVFFETGVSAVAVGSLFVFYGPHRAVLINYPNEQELNSLFKRNEVENE